MYHSDIFSMIGTLFLWLFWPSFNAYFAFKEYYFMDRAILNTVLSLCGSTVATFIVSRLASSDDRGRHKFEMVHIQNATLAGGVAIGASADLYLHPAGALGVGIVAGTISVLGYKYLQEWINDTLKIADTCGVHNLHGMPGLFGGLVSALVIGAAQGQKVYLPESEFPANKKLPFTGYPFSFNDLHRQAGAQVLGVLCSLGIAILGGLATGLITKFCPIFCPTPLLPFRDNENFIVAAPQKDIFRGTIRNLNVEADDDGTDDDIRIINEGNEEEQELGGVSYGNRDQKVPTEES